MKQRRICGVILAGGQSSRMGAEKAFVHLGRKPLLAHVIARFAPQVAALALNANGDPARFAAFGLPVIADAIDDAPSQGPLAGIIAALRFARDGGFDRLATVPADAPFLPTDLVTRLAAAWQPGARLCLAQGESGVEPLFGLWRADALPNIEAAFARGERAIHRLAAALGAAAAAFPPAPETDSFWNINTPQDLARAEAWLLGQAPGASP
jgi:molybdenum cofactor guanylyltransferase